MWRRNPFDLVQQGGNTSRGMAFHFIAFLYFPVRQVEVQNLDAFPQRISPSNSAGHFSEFVLNLVQTSTFTHKLYKHIVGEPSLSIEVFYIKLHILDFPLDVFELHARQHTMTI
jgi:hypothetical protein